MRRILVVAALAFLAGFTPLPVDAQPPPGVNGVVHLVIPPTQTIYAGGSVDFYILVKEFLGLPRLIRLSASPTDLSNPQGPPPSGIAVDVPVGNTPPLQVSANGAVFARVIVTAASGLSPGQYGVKILAEEVGTGFIFPVGEGRVVAVPVSAPRMNLAATLVGSALLMNNTISYDIIVTSVNGFSSTVVLDVARMRWGTVVGVGFIRSFQTISALPTGLAATMNGTTPPVVLPKGQGRVRLSVSLDSLPIFYNIDFRALDVALVRSMLLLGTYPLLISATSNTFNASTPVQFQIGVKGKASNQDVTILSNSTISSITYNATRKVLAFTVNGLDGTKGGSNVTVPKSALIGVPAVALDGGIIQSTTLQDQVNYYVQFTYNHSPHKVEIGDAAVIPEFPGSVAFLLLLALLLAILLARRLNGRID